MRPSGNRIEPRWRRIAWALVAGTVVPLLLARPAGAQQPNRWEITAGVPWRQFGKVELQTRDMTPGGLGLERFVDGQIQEVGAGLFAYAVDDPLTQVDAARLDRITYTDLRSDACDQDLGNAWGADIELRREFLHEGPWRLGLSASCRWLAVDAAFVGVGATTYSQYSIYPNAWPSPNPPGGGPDPTATTAYFLVHDPLQLPAGDGELVVVRHRLDLNVYELSLGGFAGWERGPMQVSVGLGPVLALARLGLESVAVLPGGSGSAYVRHDTVDDALVGLRVGTDVRWQFRPPFFAAVAVEYEWFVDDLVGDAVRLNLDGIAVRAMVGCRF